MRFTYFFSFLFIFSYNVQSNPIKKLSKVFPDYVWVESGTVAVVKTKVNNNSIYYNADSVSVKKIFVSKFEVSNAQYRKFVESSSSENTGFNLKPFEKCWTTDSPNGYQESMDTYYFTHPAYNNYPIVGITKAQAEAYCNWLTTKALDELKKRKLDSQIHFKFRLPTEEEMVYFIQGGKYSHSQWLQFANNKSNDVKFTANFGETIDQDDVQVISFGMDGIIHTAKVDFYQPNALGLYNIQGNVAEMTCSKYNDSVIVKGGSWIKGSFYGFGQARELIEADKAHSWVGFRPVAEFVKLRE